MFKKELVPELQKIGWDYSRVRKIWHGQYFLRMVNKCNTLIDLIEMLECQNLRDHSLDELKRFKADVMCSSYGLTKKPKSKKRKVTDDQVVDFYVRKRSSSKTRGIEFSLSLQSCRNLLAASKCYFTGVPITESNFSVDRVDSNKGYVKGNVVTCDRDFNMWKGVIENDINNLTYETAIKGIKKLDKTLKKIS